MNHQANFYESWLAWIEADAPEEECIPYKRNMSLCEAFASYLSFILGSEHRYIYVLPKFDSAFPFSTEEEFFYERENNISYLNKKRINWIKKQLE